MDRGDVEQCEWRNYEEPKSRNGKRTLPLDDELVAALTLLRKRQMEESEAAGAAYQPGLAALDWYQGEYVITDGLGMPVHPECYSDEFGRPLKRVALRRITLHHSTSPEYCRLPVSTRASRSRSSASGPVTMTRLSPSGPTSTRAMTT